MSIRFIKLKVKTVKTESQVRVITNRLNKIPEINYSHLDLTSSTLYIKHNSDKYFDKIIQNCLFKMGYQTKEP